jgi:hypothetical protein
MEKVSFILTEDGMQNGIKGKVIEAKSIFKDFFEFG